MKYRTIEIRPTLSEEEGVWAVYAYDVPLEREDSEGSINDLGFFHYPAHMEAEVAFNMLKDRMVARHQEEIARLTRSLELLQKVQLPRKESV